jgi:hypothetical protein
VRKVAIARVNALSPSSYWQQSLADLATSAAAPIIAEEKVDSVFVAASAACLVQRQADFAAIVSDRLGLNPRVSLAFDAADVSGAAALYAAWLHVRHGICDSALVIAAAKTSDLPEGERLALMDCTLDQEAEVGQGLGFAAQAGLLAGLYCRERKKDPAVFTEISATNHAAWAKHMDGPSLSGAEFRRDLVVAPPLVRSDFAQLLDGACAVHLRADDGTNLPLLDGVATASDVVAVWERREPLAFHAVSCAVTSALDGNAIPRWLEIDSAASVVQLLSQNALLPADGPSFSINLIGGTQARGRVLGASPLYQIADAVTLNSPYSHVLAVAVGGLASRAYAAYITRRGGP